MTDAEHLEHCRQRRDRRVGDAQIKRLALLGYHWPPKRCVRKAHKGGRAVSYYSAIHAKGRETKGDK